MDKMTDRQGRQPRSSACLARRSFLALIGFSLFTSTKGRAAMLTQEDTWFELRFAWRQRRIGEETALGDPAIDNGETTASGVFRGLIRGDTSVMNEIDKRLDGHTVDQGWRALCASHGWNLQTLAALTRFADFRPAEIAGHFAQAAAQNETGTQSETVTRIQLGVAHHFESLRMVDFDPVYPFAFSFAAAYFNPRLLEGAEEARLAALAPAGAAFVARRIGMMRMRDYRRLIERWSQSEATALRFWANWGLLMLGARSPETAAAVTGPAGEGRLFAGEAAAIQKALEDRGADRLLHLRKLVDGRQSERIEASYALALPDQSIPWVDVYARGDIQLQMVQAVARRYWTSIEL